jgi:hypothetical protein
MIFGKLFVSDSIVSQLSISTDTSYNIYGGSTGQIPYQTSPNTTGFIDNGYTGQLTYINLISSVNTGGTITIIVKGKA